jgi:DNA-binding response OmpR family regulator
VTLEFTQKTMPNGVIVADNEALMRDIVRTVLVRANQQVFPVVDGIEAVELARRFKARLVLLDIGMPRMNGLEAFAEIRALPGYADVPIVMLTGHSEEIMVAYARKLGVNDFITKPFRPNLLLARLAPYLDIPAHLRPDNVPPAGGRDQASGVKEDVWDTAHAGPKSSADEQRAVKGREVMRVWRSAPGGF